MINSLIFLRKIYTLRIRKRKFKFLGYIMRKDDTQIIAKARWTEENSALLA